MKERMNEAFLSLGGNKGDRRLNLETAIILLENKVGTIIRRSKIYETEPWGSDSSWPYLNQVLHISTTLLPDELLRKIYKIEKKLGRERSSDQNADRTIDIDILYYGQMVVNTATIQIPHPRLHLRKFILVPLNEIAPHFKDPVKKMTIKKMLETSADPLKVAPFVQKRSLKLICLEGNIGSGKTTLCELVAKKLNGSKILESFDEDVLLPLFYEDRESFALPLEFSFLNRRFAQLYEQTNNKLTVCDFHFKKSLWFAEANLEKHDYKLFKGAFGALEKKLPSCDLLVYIESPIDALLRNIKKRGRSYESEIAAPYLEAIESAYQKGLKEYYGPVLRLSVNDYGVKSTKKLLELILRHIKENFG